MASSAKTRILIISDTHCASLAGHPGSGFQAPLPAADLLIHCGDMTHTGQLDEYHKCLNMLKDIDAPVKLVIAGNHDLSLDRDYVFEHLGNDRLNEEQADSKVKQVEDLWLASDGRANSEGVTFLNEGVHRIDLPNGAHINIYASPYTPEFYDWGFAYKRNEDRFNIPGTSLSDSKNIALHPVPSFLLSKSPIDIMITHGPPCGRLDETIQGDSAGCPHLLRALMRARPLLHCFGHIHEGWGAERVSWSSNADEGMTDPLSTRDWTQGRWQAAIAENGKCIEEQDVDIGEAQERHVVFLDLSSAGGKSLRRGEETALTNASIMNARYRPKNAPWVVDLDLPKAT